MFLLIRSGRQLVVHSRLFLERQELCAARAVSVARGDEVVAVHVGDVASVMLRCGFRAVFCLGRHERRRLRALRQLSWRGACKRSVSPICRDRDVVVSLGSESRVDGGSRGLAGLVCGRTLGCDGSSVVE